MSTSSIPRTGRPCRRPASFLARWRHLRKQQLDLPRPSPNATVSQMVGVTEITIRIQPPRGEGPADLGQARPLRRGLAHGRQREHDDPVQHPRQGRRARAGGRQSTVCRPSPPPATGPSSSARTPTSGAPSATSRRTTRCASRPSPAGRVPGAHGLRLRRRDRHRRQGRPPLGEAQGPLHRRGGHADAGRGQGQGGRQLADPYQAANSASRTTPASTTPRAGSTPRSLWRRTSPTSAPRPCCSPRRMTPAAADYAQRALAAAKTLQQAPAAQQIKDLEGIADFEEGEVGVAEAVTATP